MISEQLEQYARNNKRDDEEHIGSYYAVYASCDKKISTTQGITKVHGYCTRAAYYSCIGLSEVAPNSNRLLSRKLGDYTEYMLLSILDKNGVLDSKGVKFTFEKYKINGKLDAIVKIDDTLSGVEIKSISANKWTISNIFGSKWNKAEPKIEHLLQCMVYLSAFAGELDSFYLIYIRRDNGDTIEFKIELALIDGIFYPTVDGEVRYDINCNNMLDRFTALDSYLTSNIIPPRDYNFTYTQDYAEELFKSGWLTRYMYEKYLESPFGDIQCSSCGYKDICIKDTQYEV